MVAVFVGEQDAVEFLGFDPACSSRVTICRALRPGIHEQAALVGRSRAQLPALPLPRTVMVNMERWEAEGGRRKAEGRNQRGTAPYKTPGRVATGFGLGREFFGFASRPRRDVPCWNPAVLRRPPITHFFGFTPPAGRAFVILPPLGNRRCFWSPAASCRTKLSRRSARRPASSGGTSARGWRFPPLRC